MSAEKALPVRTGGYQESSDAPVERFTPELRVARRTRVGRRQGQAAACEPAVADPDALQFYESLRKAEFNDQPLGLAMHRLLCRRRHILMWLLRTDWGVVPVSRRLGRGTLTWRSREGAQMLPMTLELWPAREHLPLAGCRSRDRGGQRPRGASLVGIATRHHDLLGVGSALLGRPLRPRLCPEATVVRECVAA